MALVALPTLPLPLLGCSLIRSERAHPEACSSAALATISALSASFLARVLLRTDFSTTTSFPFFFSRPILTAGTVNTVRVCVQAWAAHELWCRGWGRMEVARCVAVA